MSQTSTLVTGNGIRSKMPVKFVAVSYLLSAAICQPVASTSAGRWWLCMDSAHTALSCASLVATLHALFPHRPPVALVVAMAGDKDSHSVMLALGELAPQLVVCVTPEQGWLSNRGLPAEDAASAFERAQRERSGDILVSGAQVRIARSMQCAKKLVSQWLGHVNGSSQHALPINEAGETHSSPHDSPDSDVDVPVVCVTGSNYIVGSAIGTFRISD